jgi:actin-like ATPase involved in cell morphogenesis
MQASRDPASLPGGIKIGATTLQIAWVSDGGVQVGRARGTESFSTRVAIDTDGRPTTPRGSGTGSLGEANVYEVPRLLGVADEVGQPSAVHLLAFLFRTMRSESDAPIFSHTVITAPGWMSAPQRDALRHAAVLARLGSVTVVDAAVAAVEAARRQVSTGRWLVYHLGATSFDVAVVENGDVVGRESSNNWSVDTIDRVVAEYLAFWGVRQGQNIGDFTPDNPAFGGAFQRLRGEASRVRMQFARGRSGDRASIAVERLFQLTSGSWMPLRRDLSRGEVDGLVARMLDQTLAPARKLLERTGTTADQVQALVFSGGGASWPTARQRITSGLGLASVESNPLTQVVRGAALLASRHEAETGRVEVEAERSAANGVPAACLVTEGRSTAWLTELTTIGRAPDSTIIIKDASVSRDHAQVRWDPAAGHFVLEDLASTAGTSLNGAPIEPHRAYPLHGGDTIGIVNHRLKLELG